MSRAAVPAAISIVWLGGVLLGLRQVEQRSTLPGQTAAAPQTWPKNGGLQRADTGFSLLMAIHPKCPCSRASLAELSQLMARSEGHVRATVVFLQYPGVSARWAQSDTWREAQAIPGVQVMRDANGTMARQFGAATSGQTYLYDARGHLLFSGGLTAARGHEGDNTGLRAVLALLRSQPVSQTRTAVYGCPLFPHPAPAAKTEQGHRDEHS